MIRFLTRMVLQHPARFALVGTLLGVGSTFFAVELYRNLRPDIEELLPHTARSVMDLDHLAQRLESFDNLVILVFSKNAKGARRYVDDLATELRKVPKETIVRVEYRIDKEVRFFQDRQALYLDVPQLKKLQTYVQDRLEYEKAVHSPLSLFSPEDLKEPKFDVGELRKTLQSDVQSYTKFKDGYYATSDGNVHAILVYMPGKGLTNAHRMKAAIDKAVAVLHPKDYAADLTVEFTGNIENLIEESAALIADLEFSTAIVLVLVFCAMFLFYRSPWATSALLVSLIVGTLWTFGLSYFMVGYLNANTAFLASIVVGNGINFGIIFLARFLEERRFGQTTPQAVEIAMCKTATATGTAAVAAGLSYGSLMFTTFRGFSQFGVIGLAGMIFCWISAYTLLPAYLLLIDRWIAPSVPKRSPQRSPVMGRLAFAVDRFSAAICIVAVILSLLSFGTLTNIKPEIIETDFSKLRDRHSMAHGSGALYHYIIDIFGHSSSPMVVLPQKREHAVAIAHLLRAEKDKQGADTHYSSIQTLDDFIPKDQTSKIRILREIKKSIDPRYLKFVPEKDRILVSQTLNPTVLRPFTEADLPPLILEKFREVDGSIGKVVLVDKRNPNGIDDSRNLTTFVNGVRGAVDSVVSGAAVAGEQAVTYDMFEAIVHDGPRVTLYAFLMVVVLVAVLFHNLRTMALALFALALGMLWFAGIVLGFGLKLNFLNFIALPITFGIGIDYGVNIFQRYREGDSSGILNVIRSTGGAVILCSLTTIIGYSSLLMAGNRAFVSFGLLAVAGEITCVAAAVVVLPAYLRLRKQMNNTVQQQSSEASSGVG